MAELFSQSWMKDYMKMWNSDADLTNALAKLNFTSVIAYGLQNEKSPRGFIRIENGEVSDADVFSDQEVNWDLRASTESWDKWMKKPPGMMGLGTAYASGKLKFYLGDYGSMIKNPAMAGPFIKTFAVMGKV